MTFTHKNLDFCLLKKQGCDNPGFTLGVGQESAAAETGPVLFTFLHSLFSSPQPFAIHRLGLDPVSICGKDPSFNQSFICVRFLIRLCKWDH